MEKDVLSRLMSNDIQAPRERKKFKWLTDVATRIKTRRWGNKAAACMVGHNRLQTTSTGWDLKHRDILGDTKVSHYVS